jgi:RimJ/RimL family protein N-acetyltransferase
MALIYPDPPLTDGAVALRPWSMQDVPEAVRCCNEEQIRRFIPPLPIPYTEDDAIAFIGAAQERLDQGSMTFVIGEGPGAALRGSIGLRTIAPGIAQTGYWVAPEARGRGLAGTALALLSRWALATLPLIRLQLFTDVDNPASMRVAERAGFAREGTLRNWYDLRGERRDAVMFSLLPGASP